jgi:hypothetical protein
VSVLDCGSSTAFHPPPSSRLLLQRSFTLKALAQSPANYPFILAGQTIRARPTFMAPHIQGFVRILNTTFVLSGMPLVKVTVTAPDSRLEKDNVRVRKPLKSR